MTRTTSTNKFVATSTMVQALSVDSPKRRSCIRCPASDALQAGHPRVTFGEALAVSLSCKPRLDEIA